MCETSGWFWICVGIVIAILTVLSGGPVANPISNDCSRQKETDENAAWRRPMKMSSSIMRRCSDPDSAWNLVADGMDCGHEVFKNRVDGSAVHPVCVETRPSTVRRQSEL